MAMRTDHATSMATRIVHTADLGLEEPYRGLGPVPAWLKPVLAGAACAAWDHTVEVAIDIGADAVLAVAGLPGARGPAPEGFAWRFVAGLERLDAAKIPTLVVPGLSERPVQLPDGWTPPEFVQILAPGAQLGATLRLTRGAEVRFLIGQRPRPGQEVAAGPAAAVPPDGARGNGLLSVAVTAAADLPAAPAAGPASDAGPASSAGIADETDEGAPAYWALGGTGKGGMVRAGPGRPWLTQAGPAQPHSFAAAAGRYGAVVVDASGDRQPRWAAVDTVRLATLAQPLAELTSSEAVVDALRTNGERIGQQAPGRTLALRAHLVGDGPLRRSLVDPTVVEGVLAALRAGAGERVWWADVHLGARETQELHAALAATSFAPYLYRQRSQMGAVPAGMWADALSFVADVGIAP
jgi:hypothetical protein